jgi:hypothetical protein
MPRLNGRNAADYTAPNRKDGPPEIDQDMTPSEIVTVLRQLTFRTGLCTIKLDAPVRDLIVSALWQRILGPRGVEPAPRKSTQWHVP